MRILIISTFFPPLNSIASLRPYSWAKYWTQAGHDVTVLTTEKPHLSVNLNLPNNGFKIIDIPGPHFLQTLKKDYQTTVTATTLKTSESHQPNRHQSIEYKIKQKLAQGFNFIRQKTGIFSSCRMPDFADFWIRPAIKAARKEKPWDLIVSTAGPYAVHIVAASLKKSGHAKSWIADYRDTWSNSCVYPGLFPFNFIEKILEKRLLRHADAITTVSEPYASLFASQYKNKKVATIENGFDPCDLENIDPGPIFPNDNKLRIVHTGTIYSRRNPVPLFEAIALMKQKPAAKTLLDKLEVLFVGPNQAEVPSLIQKYGVGDYVKLCGFVSRQDALRMQRDAHHLIFLPWNDPASDGVLTGKLFEYLYSRTPIMAIGANALEDSQKLILEAKAGAIFTTSSEIIKFLEDRIIKSSKVKNTIDAELLKRYDRRLLAIKLLQVHQS